MSSSLVDILPVLPVGALIIAVLRNVAGIVTFGVFTPLLFGICLGSEHTGLKLLLVFSTFAIGLLTRRLLARNRLLSVSRLGLIFSVVVLSMAYGIELIERNLPSIPLESWLYPFVIVVMMIERFETISDENGSTRKALTMVAATVLCSFLLSLLVHHEGLQLLLRKYWILQAVNLAALYAVGRYSGYRLSEWWRFRHFESNEHL